MAEINIERKSGPPAWLWIVGALVLGLIAWAVISMMRGDDDDTWTTTAQDTAYTAAPAATPATAETGTAPAAVQSFSRECQAEEGVRSDDMNLAHEFSVNCFEQLAGAIQAVAGQMTGSPNVDQHVQTIRQNAQQIRASEPTDTRHAQWTREAARAGADAIESLHQAAAVPAQQAQNAVQQTRQAAQQMEAADPQLDQLTHVRSYFRNASQALDAISRQRA